MKLVIVHYHLRPGGIRRVIELATPHLVREAPCRITRVVLAAGQRADHRWCERVLQQLGGVPLELRLEPSFNYLSEQRGSTRRITAQIQRALVRLLSDAQAGNCLVWAHNLGVGRNLVLSRELAAACAARDIPLVSHHHDWWFDNRWVRWPEMRKFGFRTLASVTEAIFPHSARIVHASINRADSTVLGRHCRKAASWLPNLTEPAPPPIAARVRAAKRWLNGKLANDGAPVWLLPCRTLRRKNIAEALLLTRWLRPEAWLVVLGAASSSDELPYLHALERAAYEHHWRLRLGVLAGDESGKPTVPELLAVSEAVLLTSIQEGFGLPYLEAAAVRRPLIARRLPNVAPDLHRFGFRFPQAYSELLISPELFKWDSECARQERLFRKWLTAMPPDARALAAKPARFTAHRVQPVPFSRLTLTAQLEVLSRPARETWDACRPLNPFLKDWRQRAAVGALRVTPWPSSAKRWLSGKAYARRFYDALASVRHRAPAAVSPGKLQTDFIRTKLVAANLYPLLWNTRT